MTNAIPYNRSADWRRLRDANFFKVDDQPGIITVSKSGSGFYLCLVMAVIFGFGPLLLSPYIFPLGVLFGGVWVWGALKTMGHSYKVVFTPEELTFYGPLNNLLGTLPREAMQQIAVKEDKDKAGQTRFYYHQFIADTGWMSAFHCKGETQAAVQNNVLMAAFAQPLHQDLIDLAEPPFAMDPAAEPFAALQPQRAGRA